MTDRAEYIKGLRALADILETHPELPLPYDGRALAITFIELGEEDRRGAAVFARVMPGTVRKQPRGDYFDLIAEIHGLRLKWISQRANVCERIVTGTREVVIEEPDPAAVAALPKVARVQVVEDVEWRCHPLLASNVEQVPAVAQ